MLDIFHYKVMKYRLTVNLKKETLDIIKDRVKKVEYRNTSHFIELALTKFLKED